MVLKEDGALNAIQLLLALKDEEHSIKSQLTILEQSATYTMAVNPNIASLPVFHQLATEIATRKRKLQQLVSPFETQF